MSEPADPPSDQDSPEPSRMRRRAALGLLTAGGVAVIGGAAVGAGVMGKKAPAVGAADPILIDPAELDPVEAVPTTQDSLAWHTPRVEGYASATSVLAGETIDFHVSVTPVEKFKVTVFRLGVHTEHVHTSRWQKGASRPAPSADPVTGSIACEWPVSWTLTVPDAWASGLYLAQFTTPSGRSSNTPFVVRDDLRKGGLCVVLPFTTYQAYNLWPLDGRTGKSLYFGHNADGEQVYEERAHQVSFDRPFHGDGKPRRFEQDTDFIKWAEGQGYPLTYATSMDLHSGRLDPARYRGLVFSGHDEYWSQEMRQNLERGLDAGASAAFMTANNLYWHVRMQPSTGGRPERMMACYKSSFDPYAEAPGQTGRWRDLDGGKLAEQGVLGVMYCGVVPDAVPLVVKSSSHWFWEGTGVADGTTFPGLVGGEADGLDPRRPKPDAKKSAVLSSSPFHGTNGKLRTQSTHIHETRQGGLVFDAGTFLWHTALNRGKQHDARISRATRNLMNRILSDG